MRSLPIPLVYDGAYQRIETILASGSHPEIKFYGLTDTNVVIDLGSLEDCKIKVGDHRLAVLWYEYPKGTDMTKFINTLEIIFNGTYGLKV